MSTSETTKLRLFKSTQLSSHYIFSNGERATFIGGKYATDDPAKIAELEHQVTKRHPYIYIDTKEIEVDADYLDPMASLRKKFFAEFEAQQAEEAKRQVNPGDSVQGKLNATSSSDIAAISIGVAASAGKSK